MEPPLPGYSQGMKRRPPLTFEPKSALERLSRKAPRSLAISQTAREILDARYLRRDADGHIGESPEEMVHRVAAHVAQAERQWNGDLNLWAELFTLVMLRQAFLPNSPTLMNATEGGGQLSACFVLPATSPQKDTLQDMLQIHRTGGGTGFDLTPLSPLGRASPMDRLRRFDEATSLAANEDPRRGANMAVLAVNHPAILEFVTAKLKPGQLENFNLSVAVSDSFMDALDKGGNQDLLDPISGKRTATIKARDILTIMALSAWASGDPGVLYLDRIERDNPTPHLGRLSATNPCGELPLLPYEACTLGSINLAKFTQGSDLDWQALADTVWISTRFLDDVIEVNRFPITEIAQRSRATRKIGLGVMGFADMLVALDVSYDSQQAVQWAERIMSFISRQTERASQALADERGPFPEFAASRLAAEGKPPVRNATRLSIAPTGTISIIAGCSAGIEPYFALAMRRKALDGRIFQEIVPTLEPATRRWGLSWKDLAPGVLATGLLSDSRGIPEAFRSLFVTAQEIGWKRHLEIQAAFQRHVDNSVSKTINLPETSSPDVVFDIFLAAHALDCKGVTLFRQGSRPQQILEMGLAPTTKAAVPAPHAGENQAPMKPSNRGVGPTNCPRCQAPALAVGPYACCVNCAWSDVHT